MKLSAWVIYIIGLAVAIIALSFGYFHQYAPNTAEAKLYNDRAAELEEQAALQKKAEKRVKDAVALVNESSLKWKKVVGAKTPATSVNAGGIDLAVNHWQLSVDTQKFARNVQRAVNKQIHTGGVKVLEGPTVSVPDVNAPVNGLLASFYNYPAFPYPILILDLGQVTVEGTYAQILANVRSYSAMPRYLAMADGLSLTGTDDKLTGTYRVQVVGFIRGSSIYPSVPEGTAAAVTGGAGGFGGGAGRPGGSAAAGPGGGAAAGGGGGRPQRGGLSGGN